MKASSLHVEFSGEPDQAKATVWLRELIERARLHREAQKPQQQAPSCNTDRAA